MALVVETGAGLRNANSYIATAFVTTYLTDRNRVTENTWSSRTTAEQEAAVIAATDYIEKRFGARFKGYQEFTFEEVFATATLTFSGLPLNGETLTLGDETWTFVTTSTGADYEIVIGADAAGTATNVVSAISGTSRHATATADSAVVTFTAEADGTSGNDTVLSGTITNGVIVAFSGGQDGGSQPLSFPRCSLYDRSGIEVLGIPRKLKEATAEYAVRAVVAALMTDGAIINASGAVERIKEKVGPIETETRFVDGSYLQAQIVPYPAADRLLSEFMTTGGAVIR